MKYSYVTRCDPPIWRFKFSYIDDAPSAYDCSSLLDVYVRQVNESFDVGPYG